MKTKEEYLAIAHQMNKNTMMEALGVEYIEVTEGFVSARMPVDKRTHQPVGLLHGGASAALVETLGSMGSALLVDPNEFNVTGIEVNTNHVKGVREGWVIGKGKIIHQGKSTHIWNVDIFNEQDELVATGRLTVLIIPKKK
jgi:1,4-dihydroxy-2-naphthoyl-CoA hydrolase